MNASDVRKLVVAVSAVVLVDTAFYTAIAPLLPSLTHALHLSILAAGMLTASYPAGMLIGSLPSGMLAARIGPRATVYVGLTVLAAASVVFGTASGLEMMDVARFLQGLGGACAWAGGLTWLVSAVGAHDRGAVIGSAIGAAIAGALLGPVIGTLAHVLGRAIVFSSMPVCATALIWWSRHIPATFTRSHQGLRDLWTAARRRSLVLAMWLVLVPAVVSGVISVLGPLRLNQFGAGAGVVGATFLVAAGIEAAISPMIGRMSDRRGYFVPLRVGLVLDLAALMCFTLPRSPELLAVVIIAIIGALAALWTPATAMFADAADATDLSQGLAFALMNVAWAAGQITGSGGGGALAKLTGDGVPIVGIAVLCALTLLLVTGRTRTTVVPG